LFLCSLFVRNFYNSVQNWFFFWYGLVYSIYPIYLFYLSYLGILIGFVYAHSSSAATHSMLARLGEAVDAGLTPQPSIDLSNAEEWQSHHKQPGVSAVEEQSLKSQDRSQHTVLHLVAWTTSFHTYSGRVIHSIGLIWSPLFNTAYEYMRLNKETARVEGERQMGPSLDG
jgi:hypothetical protein